MLGLFSFSMGKCRVIVYLSTKPRKFHPRLISPRLQIQTLKVFIMSLTQELANKKKASSEKLAGERWDIMSRSTQQLKDRKLSEGALGEGDTITGFNLPDVNGNLVSLDSILEEGHAVISFYRGGWCPYCNMELRALQQILPQIKEAGANLVAISPETPDNSLTTSEKNELS